MHRITKGLAWLSAVLLAASLSAPAAEIQWTRMAGQWPVEAAALVGKFSGGTAPEILVVNRGGQVLLWDAEGKPRGAGQDGAVAQLPTNRWTSALTRTEMPAGAQFLVASVEGLVVGLDSRFQQIWQYQLPGATSWGRAIPAVLSAGFVFADQSGTATCLSGSGVGLWTNRLGLGSCQAPPRSTSELGGPAVLIAAGATLVCGNADGSVRWRRTLDSDIVTRPEVLAAGGPPLLLCGTASGVLFALNSSGEIRWRCETQDTFSNWIVPLPRGDQQTPLILFTGLWGNLHAVDLTGRPVWTHFFRAKTRAAPLVVDTDGDGHAEIYVPTFHQHVLAFDENGTLQDDLRLSGIMPSGLTSINDPATHRMDLLVTTTTLLSYRLRAGLPRSPYGPTPPPQDVALHRLAGGTTGGTEAVRVENPRGGLLKLQVSVKNAQGWVGIVGAISARSDWELPLPSLTTNGPWNVHATASDPAGNSLSAIEWRLPEPNPGSASAPAEGRWLGWATPPYAAFSATNLSDRVGARLQWQTNRVEVRSLYLDEVDQGAMIIASTLPTLVRGRVALGRLAREDGTNFSGACSLHEVISTGSVNGEQVPDALPALGDAGLVTIPSHQAVKLWLRVDAHGALPGQYTGSVAVVSLGPATNRIEWPVEIEVLNLRLPAGLPLRLCTWDYVPNRWFPTRSGAVLDDMARHGVNIFPRTIIPPGHQDPSGKLTIAWPVLDAELDRLKGRGKILFHLNQPPIDFDRKPSDAEKRGVELEYIRELRDHLRERGWNYGDYAFYLLDEPGLDNGLNLPVLLEAGQLLREADPRLLTYTDPVAGLSWRDFERIEPLVDVWAPNMRLVSGLLSGDPRIARILKQKTVWSYECVSQVKSLSPLCYNRANAWRAAFFGLQGIGFWTHSTTEVDPWLPGKTINDEYALVYPGELPVPSLRWEAVRDGLEDIAALQLLEDRMAKRHAAGTHREVIAAAKAAVDRMRRDVMELSDGAFTESRDFLRAGDRVLGHTATDVALFHRQRAEIARLTLALGPD